MDTLLFWATVIIVTLSVAACIDALCFAWYRRIAMEKHEKNWQNTEKAWEEIGLLEKK